MALTDDQRAMLRLLARREEGYEDIAALMGISVEEVRARVKDSLGALDAEASGAAPAPEAEPVQAATPAPPPAVAPPPAPAEPPAAAPVAPGPPATPPPSAAAAAKPSLAARAGSWAGRARSGDRRRLVELVGGGLIVLLIVLFATGTINFGGDDDGGNGDSANGANGGNAAVANGRQQPTQAELSAVDGSDAKGQAVFGRLKQGVALAIAAEGMRPTPKGSSYAISLAKESGERVPIAAVRVGQSGRIAEQVEVPTEALGLLASGFDALELSLVVNSDLRRVLTGAQQAKKPPVFDSTDVLRGDVTGPIVDANTD